jgi:hypothetical protein
MARRHILGEVLAYDPRTFLVLTEINRCLLVIDRVRHMQVSAGEKLHRAQNLIQFRDLPVYTGEEVLGMRRRILDVLEGIEREVALRDPLEVARLRISAFVT